MSGAIPPSPNTPSWCGAQLRHGDVFTFTFLMAYFKALVIKHLLISDHSE